MSYQYWDSFIDIWRQNTCLQTTNPFLPWTSPISIPLMNSNTPNDHSLFYIPEPWWGNNGMNILQSVVINYNPGSGGPVQHFQNVTNFYGSSTYSDFVNKEATHATNHFYETNRWHYNRRAKRIFGSLSSIGVNLNTYDQLTNHLSIELIPWHTMNIVSIKQYVLDNIKEIYQNSIVFAANESARIINSTLKNKVILRLSGSKTIEILDLISSNGITGYQLISGIGKVPDQNGNGKYLKFSINTIPGVEFISIWGIRNDFPGKSAMDWIFQNVI